MTAVEQMLQLAEQAQQALAADNFEVFATYTELAAQWATIALADPGFRRVAGGAS